ncbi:hypothetical protein HOY80DRAFT_734279 [Tuber brumale]|nr:hypothetical protein HOY80DRAFT_734279 [Tuber brumale]
MCSPFPHHQSVLRSRSNTSIPAADSVHLVTSWAHMAQNGDGGAGNSDRTDMAELRGQPEVVNCRFLVSGNTPQRQVPQNPQPSTTTSAPSSIVLAEEPETTELEPVPEVQRAGSGLFQKTLKVLARMGVSGPLRLVRQTNLDGNRPNAPNHAAPRNISTCGETQKGCRSMTISRASEEISPGGSTGHGCNRPNSGVRGSGSIVGEARHQSSSATTSFPFEDSSSLSREQAQVPPPARRPLPGCALCALDQEVSESFRGLDALRAELLNIQRGTTGSLKLPEVQGVKRSAQIPIPERRRIAN